MQRKIRMVRDLVALWLPAADQSNPREALASGRGCPSLAAARGARL